MKKSLIAAAIGAVIAPSVYANVVITEVVEGSQSNKAIEIANVGSSAISRQGKQHRLLPRPFHTKA